MPSISCAQQPFETAQVLEASLRRVQGEYREMPGLSLTVDQASYLFGLPAESCGALLDVLVTIKFLRRTPRGSYMRCGTV